MAKERIQIKKIANASARQVTFSKRRRGLFKKAEQLSVLCDADVAIIIVSSSSSPDKIFDYSSSSSPSGLATGDVPPRVIEASDLSLGLR